MGQADPHVDVLARAANTLHATARAVPSRSVELTDLAHQVGAVRDRLARGQDGVPGRMAGRNGSDIEHPRPDRILRVQGLVALIPGAVTADVPAPFPCKARVVGIGFGVLEGTFAALCALTIRVDVRGGRALFTTGQAAAFAHPASWAINAMTNAGYFPIDEEVSQNDSWQVSVQNELPGGGGGATGTPVVQFFYQARE
ncbi:MAG: hypothetical protein ACHQQR_00755 [Gemmatimonadales bacterium]